MACVNASDQHIIRRRKTSALKAKAIRHQGAVDGGGGAIAEVESTGGDEPQIDGIRGCRGSGGLDVAGDAGGAGACGVNRDTIALNAVKGHGRRQPEVGGVAGGHTRDDRLGAVHRLVDQPRGQPGDTANVGDILLVVEGLGFEDRGNGRSGVVAVIQALVSDIQGN